MPGRKVDFLAGQGVDLLKQNRDLGCRNYEKSFEIDRGRRIDVVTRDGGGDQLGKQNMWTRLSATSALYRALPQGE